MNKEQKRKVQLQQRTFNESLTFQTMFGAKQKFDSLTPEIETRIKEELLVFANLGIAKDLMTLRDVMDKVKEQAKAYGHSNTRELAFLVAHSMLHLMGYDHMVEEERIVMERKQEEILKSCGYIREMES